MSENVSSDDSDSYSVERNLPPMRRHSLELGVELKASLSLANISLYAVVSSLDGPT